MARPISRGFPYFTMDSDIFFADRNIKALMGRHGTDGLVLYLYILCEVYRQEGYYAQYDDVFVGCAASQLNMSCGDIETMLDCLIERSLLSRELFEEKRILTSHGIQLRFQEMSRERGRKNEVIVDSDLWLLKTEETEKYVTFNSGKNDSYSGNNPDYSGNNPDNSRNNPPKEKKSKEKESKVNESKVNESITQDAVSSKKTYGDMQNVLLTDEEYKKLQEKFPHDYIARINSLSFGISSKGYNYKSHYAAILQWAENAKISANKEAEKRKSKFHNFEEREYSPDDFDDIYFDELKEELRKDGYEF